MIGISCGEACSCMVHICLCLAKFTTGRIPNSNKAIIEKKNGFRGLMTYCKTHAKMKIVYRYFHRMSHTHYTLAD